MFEEPGRAIARNTIVISLGFTPLLFAPLIPYQTVGVFLASIMLYSGLATLWMLPALLTVMQRWMFKDTGRQSTPAAARDEENRNDNRETNQQL
jgi:predicted RND superfamily exporter protein